MLIKNKAPYRVLLPERIWKEAQNKEHFKQLLTDYMRSYPDYIVKAIEGRMAVCERMD
jgi:hypothetical protein